MDRERGKLSNDPAFVSSRAALEDVPVDVFQKFFLKGQDEYIIAGDEVVDSKAGKKTYGLDRFFSGVEQRVIPGLSFFALSLVNVREEHSYPLQISKIVISAAEKAASQAKAEAKRVQKSAQKKKRERPKGSKNKDKQYVVLNPELLRTTSACYYQKSVG